MRMYILIFLLFFSKLSALDILYEVKEPYIYIKDGKITGYSLPTILNALKDSNIRYTLIEKSFEEQLAQIKENQKEVCAIGWNKRYVYEKFTKYTKAIYQDKPYGIITQKKRKIEQKTNIADIIKQRKYRVLVKKDFPYSQELTNILKQLPKKIVNTPKDYNIVTLIAKKKGDIAFMQYEDAMVFLQRHKYRSRVKFVELSGMQNGKKKYLACSSKVTNQTILKINNQIK